VDQGRRALTDDRVDLHSPGSGDRSVLSFTKRADP
jgi:hypothetical protein